VKNLLIKLLIILSILALSCAESKPIAIETQPKEQIESITEPTATAQQSADPTPRPTNTASPVSNEIDPIDTVDQSEVTEEISESTYDPNCMIKVLGRPRTDDIVYFDAKIDQAELTSIQHCKLGKPEMENDFEEDRGGDDDRTRNDERPEDDDRRAGDERPEDDDRRRNEDRPEDDDKRRYDDEEWECSGDQKDESGLPKTPDCNVPPAQLPNGVVAADLNNVTLPVAKYEQPFDSCQIYEGEQCSELKWEKVSDVQAGEFVEIKISPVDSNIMYAGVDSNDMTMYRSTDAGANWDLVHVTGHVGSLALSPVDKDIAIYTNLEWSVQATFDGGESWESVVGFTADQGNVIPFTAIQFSSQQPNIVYAAALQSGDTRGDIWPAEPSDLYKSIDSGKTWTKTGTCSTCSAIDAIVVMPDNPEVIWVAGDGGVQYTRDDGVTWSGNVISYLEEVANSKKNLNENNPPKVMGLDIHPNNPNIILAASTNEGMFRSSDGGLTWERINNGLNSLKLHHVHFAPSNGNVAYVTSHDGIFRSNDSGKSWTDISEGLAYKFLTPVAIDPTDENIVFIGTATEVYTTHPKHKNRGMHKGEGLYKSIDGGKTWYRSDKGIYEAKIAQMGNHPIVPFNLWVGGESGRGNFFSPDAGDSWWFSPSITSHYPMVYAFTYDFPYVIYTTGWLRTGELTASTDFGASWYVLTHEIEAGLSEETYNLGLRLEGAADFHLHGVAVAPSNSDVIYVGSVHDSVYPDLTFNLDGAHIFKSSDAGKSFKEMSNGFPIETKTSINSIIVHPTNPDIAYAMTSLHETTTAIGIYKTTNGAESWFEINDGLDEFTNDLQMDPIDPEILYAATESGIYKSANGGQKWDKSSTGIPKGAVIDMAIDPINPNVLYAITADDIYRTQNAGKNWYSVNLGLPLLEPSSKPLSAQEKLFGKLLLDRTQTGHSEYGGTFAQDRTLEIDSTGKVIFVAVKTSRNDRDKNSERLLYRAILTPLISLVYEFAIKVDGRVESIEVTSQSHIFEMTFNTNSKELSFMAGGPKGTNSSTTVSIPNTLLSGQLEVLVDGIRVPSSNGNDGVTFDLIHAGSSQVTIKAK